MGAEQTVNRQVEAILFDLDGTLIDTNELIIRSCFYALQDVRPDLTREEIIPQMGKPLTEQMNIWTGQEEVGKWLVKYREFNLAHHDELVHLFPGVKETLAGLRAAGVRMAIVTTKMRASTERSLRHFGILDWFDAIVTIEDVSHPKPHPEPIERALAIIGSSPERALMVGDSSFDLLAAQAAGVRALGVAWSLKGEAYLRQFSPVQMIHEMTDVFDMIK